MKIVDTYYGQNYKEYIKTIEAFGFKKIYETDFQDFTYDKLQINHYFIYWKNGILLAFDTYFEDKVNSATFYTVWKVNPHLIDSRRDYTSSGHFLEYNYSTENYIWVGNWDARENLIGIIMKLGTHGDIVSPWPENPINWLIHYKEHVKTDGVKGFQEFQENSKKLTLKRIATFPDHVKECIGNIKE